jgi:hypothetical protein
MSRVLTNETTTPHKPTSFVIHHSGNRQTTLLLEDSEDPDEVLKQLLTVGLVDETPDTLELVPYWNISRIRILKGSEYVKRTDSWNNEEPGEPGAGNS